MIGILAGLALLGANPALAQEQRGDPDYRPVVASPAYPSGGPRILLDAAHGSVQTIDGRYMGFTALARADGYEVVAGTLSFDTPGALDGVDVLVISNAAARSSTEPSAFTEAEIVAIDAWVRNGGALLLAADHAPHGSAAQALATRLGVEMGTGYAFRVADGGLTTNLLFEGDTLGDHLILRGRRPEETVAVVRSFTGQSLSGPPGAVVLLATLPGDREAVDRDVLGVIRDRLEAGDDREAVLAELSTPALPAQGLAFEHGRGRVVVLGEAGMLTAQLIRFPPEEQREDFRFGLTTEGHDDEQFVLNVLHWLSGALD
nr:GldG family protein [Brevundimonas sp. A19_0]